MGNNRIGIELCNEIRGKAARPAADITKRPQAERTAEQPRSQDGDDV